MNEENRSKISLPETIIILLYIVPLDLISLGLVFIGLDDFWIIDILTFPVTQFYFRIKGAKATADLVAGIVELIPYIGALPIKTVGVILTIYFTNHPPKALEAVGGAIKGGALKGSI